MFMSASFWLLAACGEYASRGKGLNCSMSATTGFFQRRRKGEEEKKLETRKRQKTAGGRGQRWQRWRPGNFYYILLFISNGNVKNSHETYLSEVGFGVSDSVAFGFNRAWEERFPKGSQLHPSG